MALTLDDVKDYLKVDYSDEDNYLVELMDVSLIYIQSMCGTDYLNSTTDATKVSKLVELAQKKIIADLYENRGTEIANNTKQDRILTSILDKVSNYYTDPTTLETI